MLAVGGKKVVVMGFGVTGTAVARTLCDMGARVAVTEALTRPELGAEGARAMDTLAGRGVAFHLGGHSEGLFASADLVVKSPGIRLDHPALTVARDAGVKVIGELDLAAHYFAPPIAAVTGTNGKSTVTALLEECLKRSTLNAFVGGNIGRPFIEAAADDSYYDLAVLEVSSFQLAEALAFHPHVAVLLNLAPDHLDWHGGIEAYRDAKAKIFAHQEPEDFLVVNGDDAWCAAAAREARSTVLEFSRRRRLSRGAWVEEDDALVRLESETERYPLGRVKLAGAHNRENVLAALLTARLCGVVPEAIQEALETFGGLAHRMQWVARVNGVDYYDDSKATNTAAAAGALESMEAPVVLLAGGLDKGGRFRELRGPAERRARLAVVFGAAGDRLAADLEGAVPILRAQTMAEAVEKARAEARAGEAVLLSPACASFDEFTDYRARGEAFQKLVRSFTDNG